VTDDTDDVDKQDAATWDEVEKEIVLIGNLIKRLPPDNQQDAAFRIALEAVIWGADTGYTVIGILEEVKQSYLRGLCEEDCCCDEGG